MQDRFFSSSTEGDTSNHDLAQRRSHIHDLQHSHPQRRLSKDSGFYLSRVGGGGHWGVLSDLSDVDQIVKLANDFANRHVGHAQL